LILLLSNYATPEEKFQQLQLRENLDISAAVMNPFPYLSYQIEVQMATIRGNNHAFGWPGLEPRWTRGDKDGIGTAYSAASRIWFTLWNGIVTEVYYPTVDSPQMRDVQLLFTDGESFFHQETRYLETRIERMPSCLGYRIEGKDPEGRYTYEKEVISDPHLPCLLQRVRVKAKEWRSRLKTYVLCAPHLDVGGSGNNAYVVQSCGREVLVAEKNGTWLALGCNVPFSRLSVGYVGASDGWTDLAQGFRFDWQFDQALNGNVALTGEMELAKIDEFVFGIAFGNSQQRAIATLFQSLAQPFETHRTRFVEQWQRTRKPHAGLEEQSGDDGHLFRASYKLLLAHEDKAYQGAMVASLAIPWGESKGDQEGEGGYHLVWTRDMVQSATGLLAAGNVESPLRSLIYLATCQMADGGFAQNFWVDGTAFWSGVQLDEVAFPILLAHKLRRMDGLREFDPYPMVLKAAAYLIRQGPVTGQERWEEASGYSPSTLAVIIAALTCVAHYAVERGDENSARLIQQFADWLEHNLESWTVTNEGTLLGEVKRHYVRLNPSQLNDPLPTEDAGKFTLFLNNQPPGRDSGHPAREIVDAGFLELVRFGVRAPDDAVIRDSLRVVDATLKVETPSGTCWHRYNSDGYGQREDGGPFLGSGKGRGWPLLTGERGHYELAAKGDAATYIRWMERFATPTHLIPEQIWDEPDRPEQYLKFGRATGAAVPLLWAHAEYIKLLRSAHDGAVFDVIPEVADRYIHNRPVFHNIQFWSMEFPSRTVRPGDTLRIQTGAAYRLHFSLDNWKTEGHQESIPTNLGINYCDLAIPQNQQDSIRFTLFWRESNRWEGRDFEVACAT
jgi:glucoamylase